METVLDTLCKEGRLYCALQTMDMLQQRGDAISRNMFYQVLQGCISKKDITAGRELYRLILRSKLKSDGFLSSHLVRMFGVCGSLVEANYAFSQQPNPSVYMWSAIISAHSKLGQNHQAIELYNQMQQHCVKPDGHLFVAVLKACSSLSVLSYGEVIHAHIIEIGVETNVFVGSALIDMYGRCGSIEASRGVFERFLIRDVVIWSAMIANYAEHEKAGEAFQLFHELQCLGLQPNHVTLTSLLKACSNISDLRQGKLIHTFIIESVVDDDMIVGNNLINMYAKCRSLQDACVVFDKLPKQDVVTWNVLIAGYTQEGQGLKALGLFEQMLLAGVQPDQVTFMSILKGCSNIASLDQGKLIHSQLIQSGFELDAFLGSILIDMYINCGCLEYARNVFDSVLKRDAVIWSAMIGGYVKFEHGSAAIQLLQRMQQENVEPDNMTFASIVKACSLIAALEQGKLAHAFTVEYGLTLDVVIGNALIDMYARSGSLKDAIGLFSSMQTRDLVTWNAIILGYAQHNDYINVLQHFRYMQQGGVQPNDVTFVILLSACSHRGLVNEGVYHFKSMREDHGIMPLPDHYNCMVDLLGRTGYLLEAQGLLNSARPQLNVVGWMCLLGHCKTHKDVDCGRRCFNNIMASDNRNAGAFILMSKIYSDAGMDREAEMLENQRVDANVSKAPGKASIEVDREVHFFVVGDRSHSETDMIYRKLNRLSERMKDEGYMLQRLCNDK